LERAEGAGSRSLSYDVTYLYVTGLFTVILSLVPFFRGNFKIPLLIPIWAALYIVYRYKLIPEKYKFLVNGFFLAGCYLVLGYIASSFDGTFHGADVLAFEERIFGILPSRWLQDHFLQPGVFNWYNYPLAFCHSLFFSFPFAVPWLIRRSKGITAMKRAILAFALLTTWGYTIYILWPLTPPWLLAADGVTEPLNRCVFTALTRIIPHFLVSGASNTPRAAMPSLHAGETLLMVLLLFRELGAKRAWWSLVLLAAICFEIIYGAEHFVCDIAAGFLLAVAAFSLSYLPRFEKE
jgi:hypothetical protein